MVGYKVVKCRIFLRAIRSKLVKILIRYKFLSQLYRGDVCICIQYKLFYRCDFFTDKGDKIAYICENNLIHL